MSSGRAFVIQWLDEHHHDEMHAVCVSGGERCLVRIEFPDFAFVTFHKAPSPSGVIELRKRFSKNGVMIKQQLKRTIVGYQKSPETPVLFIRGVNLSEVFKDAHFKNFLRINEGHVEEFTQITRSRKLTALQNMSQCCWISLEHCAIVPPENKISKVREEYKLDTWENLKPTFAMEDEASFMPPSIIDSVLSFDIEVFGDCCRKMPDPTVKENFILCISVVSKKKKTLHTLFDVHKVKEYDLTGVFIFRYTSESEMIRGFWDQVASEMPLFLIGFNTQSWDFRYLHERMKVHSVQYPPIDALSIYNRGGEGKIRMRRGNWSSAGMQYNDIFYPSIPGVVILDLHKFFLRNRPKLQKHSLDFISRYYLGRGKYAMSQERMVQAYESQDPDALAAVAQYNIEDAQLVLDLFFEKHIFAEIAVEAVASETLIEDLYTKGIHHRVLNKLYRYAKKEDFVFSLHDSTARLPGGGVDATLKGASVVLPKGPGRFFNVGVFDMKSMYPTLLLVKNLCYTTFVPSPSSSNNTYTWQTKDGTSHEASFVNTSTRVGLCGLMLQDLIILRGKLTSKFAQQAVKIMANSLIGVMAAPLETSRLSFPAAAGVVFTAGREIMKQIIDDLSETKNVVYSDTDSVFVADEMNPDEILRYLNETYTPFAFSLEAYASKLLLMKPKTYIMQLKDDEGEPFVFKGVSFSRKSESHFISSVLKEITAMIFNETVTKSDILKFMNDKIDHIAEEDIEELAMSTKISLSGNIGKKLFNTSSARLQIGDSVDYINVLPSGERITLEEYETLVNPPRIDVDFYANKLRASVDRLLVF